MDLNPPTAGELAYGDASKALREIAELRGRVAALSNALVRVAYLLSAYGVTSPGNVREALEGPRQHQTDPRP